MDLQQKTFDLYSQAKEARTAGNFELTDQLAFEAKSIKSKYV